MPNLNSFTGGQGANYNATISATTTSATATLTPGMSVLRLAVTGASPIAFRTGLASAGAVTAVFTTDTVILPGGVEYFSMPETYDTLAVVSSGTATVYASRGEGE